MVKVVMVILVKIDFRKGHFYAIIYKYIYIIYYRILFFLSIFDFDHFDHDHHDHHTTIACEQRAWYPCDVAPCDRHLQTDTG